jgi:putative aldouronate transport system substrate-binding protein
VLAGILTASSCAGCSKKVTVSGTGRSSTPVVLKAYMLGPQQKGLQQVLDKVNAITSKAINATIKITFMDFDSYDDKTKLILSSGEDCDLMFSAGWLHYPTYVGQNAYKPLDELLNKYGSDIKKSMQDGYFKAATVKGKIYAIPTNKDNAGTAGFIINKKIAEKYKMDFSKFSKPADIIPYLETIKKNEPNMIPFVGMHGDNIVSIPQRAYYDNDWCYNLGLPKDGTTKMVNTFDNSKIMDAVKVAREIYVKGYTNADIATTQSVSDYENKQKAFCWIETLKPGKAAEMESQLGYDVIQINGYGSDQKPTIRFLKIKVVD